jgi:hypothetical protein
MRHPCEVARLVADVESQITVIRNAKQILREIGVMSIRRLDRRYE